MKKVSGKWYWQDAKMQGVMEGKEVYGGVILPRYADSKTVEAYLNGQKIKPVRFTIFGDPRFSIEDLKKYEKLNEEYKNKYHIYHAVKVKVKYKEKQMALDKDIYDTAEGILNYAKDLKTLSEILDARCIHERVYPSEYLNKISFFHFQFDQCGNILEQCDEHFFTFGSIPDHESKCPICGHGWTIDDLKVGYENYNYIYENGEEYHKSCLHVKEINLFKNLFNEVYPNADYTIIPNEYCKGSHIPWMIISTPDGNIKIGRRKRVFHIEWMDNYKPFSEKFDNEHVTKKIPTDCNRCFTIGTRYIHAFSKEKALEYLKEAKDSQVNI